MMFRFTYLIQRIFLVLTLLCFLGIGVQGAAAQESAVTQEKIIACFDTVSQEGREDCYVEMCAGVDSFVCAESIVRSVAPLDAAFAMAVLQQLSQTSYFLAGQSDFDGYRPAQTVGEVVFQGADRNALGDVLVSCTPGFYRGCYHGFLVAASKSGLTPENAAAMCGVISDVAAQKECYQAVGYMVLELHHPFLHKALLTCDAWDPLTRDYCYDGVFTENSADFLRVLFNSSESGSDGVGVHGFRENSPLAPCNLIGKAYREACYRNHGRYLIHFFEDTFFHPADVCFEAGKYESVCRQSVADAYADLEREQSSEFDTGTLPVRSWWQKIIDFILSLFGG